MASRSTLGLIYMLRGLQELGEDLTPVLERYGISIDSLDPGGRIDRALELRIYTEAAEILKDPLTGLKTGTFFGFAGYGPFIMLLMTCANAYEAFQTGIRYQQLTYLYGQLRLEPGEKETALVLTPVALPPKAFRFRVDGELSGTYKLVRDMQTTLGVNIHAERIELPYPAPAEAAFYEEYLRVPVSFGARETRIWISNEYLQLRFPTADPTAHALYKRQCDQLLIEHNATPDQLSEKVCAHLGLFTEHFPNAAAVAAAFGIAERSLRHQLSQEGASFRGILDDVRFQKARQLLLETVLPVDAIARMLGYAESAAFIHAFQRWSGTTPAAFRKKG